MRKTSLYRHFDGDGRLLYVGISMSSLARQAEHKYSPWHESIVRIELEWHPSRQHALYAEAVAIRDEKPLHNVLKPIPMVPYMPGEDEEAEMRVLGPCLTAVLPSSGEHRTILYTIVPSGADAQAKLDSIVASITDGFGVAIADFDQKADGFIRMFQLAQVKGTRILTDRPDAFSVEARNLIAAREMYLHERPAYAVRRLSKWG